MTRTFIKDPTLIEENYQVDDLLDFSSIINEFKESINNIDKNSIVALIGPYGSGKSTMLYQIYKDQNQITSNSKGAKWFTFDAWQYPERKDLWESFVLDISRQCSTKSFGQVKNKIDGTQGHRIKGAAMIAADAASYFVPVAKILKNLTRLFNTSPVKRVFEFQELLSGIINKINNDIFIIVEDIDRSGDMGVYFLETLKHFIKTQDKESEHKIIVIVPMGDNIFNKNNRVRDSYTKILDYRIPFNTELIKLTRFIENTININILVENTNNTIKVSAPDVMLKKVLMAQILYFFENMLLKEQQATMRDIKNILRKSELNFRKLKGDSKKLIDIRILILFTTIEYLYQKDNKYIFSSDNGGINIANISNEYITNNFWGMEFLYFIARNLYEIEIYSKEDMAMANITYRIRRTDQDNWIPFIQNNAGRDTINLNSIYFSATGVKVVGPK